MSHVPFLNSGRCDIQYSFLGDHVLLFEKKIFISDFGHMDCNLDAHDYGLCIIYFGATLYVVHSILYIFQKHQQEIKNHQAVIC